VDTQLGASVVSVAVVVTVVGGQPDWSSLYWQHHSFFGLVHEVLHVLFATSQLNGHPLPFHSCSSQQKSFLSWDQPVCQAAAPALQSNVCTQPSCSLSQHHPFFSSLQPFFAFSRPSRQSNCCTSVALPRGAGAPRAPPTPTASAVHPIFSCSQHHCIAFFLPVVGVPETFERLLQMYPPSSGSHGNGLSPVALRPSTGLGHLK